MQPQPIMNLLVAGGPLLAGGVPALFLWDPENGGELPTGATITRASVAWQFTGSLWAQVATNTVRDNHRRETGGDRGYLSEPQATNQFDNVDLTDAYWSAGVLDGPVDNGVTDLGLTEYEYDDGVAFNFHRLTAVATTALGSCYMISKASTNGQFQSIRRGGAIDDYACFDFVAGTVSEEGAGILQSLITDFGNGWYKAEINTNDTGDLNVISISPNGTPGTSTPQYSGANRGMKTCHVQNESTLYSTSPMISAGTDETRQADVLDSGVEIPEEFSAIISFTAPDVIPSGDTVSLLGASVSNVDIIRIDNGFNVIMDDGGTPVTIGTVAAAQRFKVAYARDASSRGGSLDGAAAVTGGAPAAGHVGENFHLFCTAGLRQARGIGHLMRLLATRVADGDLPGQST